MMIATMTLEQEKWMTSQVKPCPEVLVLAYAGTSHKEWKIVTMCSIVEYWKVADWEAAVKRRYASATLIRIYMLDGATGPNSERKE